MTRKFKALGLALFAVLALSAVSVSSASAAGEQFHSAEANTTLTVKSNNNQVFTTTTGAVTCSKVAIDTTVAPVTTKEITSKPTYSGTGTGGACSGPLGLGVHIDFMSCAYIFTSEIPVGKEHAPAHIECNTGDEITIQATVFGAKVPCIDVPAQTPTTNGVKYINGNDGIANDITIKATVGGIKYTETGVCGEGVANDGTYNGEVTVIGENAAGVRKNIEWK